MNFIFIIISLISGYIFSQSNINNCPTLPENNIWNTSTESLPIHSHSDDYVNSIGGNLSLRYDFGAGVWDNAPIGIPYVLVDGSQEKVKVTFEYTDESDNVLYPIPLDPPIEGGNESTGDRHILIVDTTNCILYELYSAYKNSDGTWRAGSGSVFDLNSNNLRTDTWTSADAAGLPILPGLVRYDEVASGSINHLIRFTVPKTQRAYLWPARHYASSITDENFPPMGLVMRLKKSVNIDNFTPQAKIIATALKKYGMILADNGSAWYMSGVPDERWDNNDLYTLRQYIKGSDFEAIDLSSLIVNVNSGEAKQNNANYVENENEVNIYPNPTSNFFSISNYKGSIHIFNILGQLVLSEDIATNQKINISLLKEGQYFIKTKSKYIKFIKI